MCNDLYRCLAAENDLFKLWMGATDQNSVAAASNAIDARLRRDPYAQSESRDEGERVMFVAPLGIIYRLSEADRLVTVSAVWRIDRARPQP